MNWLPKLLNGIAILTVADSNDLLWWLRQYDSIADQCGSLYNLRKIKIKKLQ